MKNKVVIIFSGYNPRAVVAFLRTLESNELPYAIVAKSDNDEIFLTYYKEKVICIRESVALVLDEILESIRYIKKQMPADEYIIAPTSEFLNRFFINNVKYFENLNCYVPLVNKKLYKTISDKYSFSMLCSKYGIDTPKKFDCKTDLPIPFVAKPRKYFSNNYNVHKPQIIKNSKEKATFFNNYSLQDFYFEEFVSGESIYLLYYFYKDGSFMKYSQKNFIQQPDGASIIAAESSDFHMDPESNKYEELLNRNNFNGLIMIEVKKSQSINYMIEANPRFWGPSQLFVDAGTNMFESFLYDNKL